MGVHRRRFLATVGMSALGLVLPSARAIAGGCRRLLPRCRPGHMLKSADPRKFACYLFSFSSTDAVTSPRKFTLGTTDTIHLYGSFYSRNYYGVIIKDINSIGTWTPLAVVPLPAGAETATTLQVTVKIDPYRLPFSSQGNLTMTVTANGWNQGPCAQSLYNQMITYSS